MPLNAKQAQFVAEYLVDLNATQAAIRAGYSEATAQEQGSRLLSNVMVQAALQRAMAERGKRTEISQDRIIQELALIAFADMRDYAVIDAGGGVTLKPFEEMPEGASRVVGKIKEKRKLLSSGEGDGDNVVLDSQLEYGHWDKVKALELLGKHMGLWTDKLKVSGDGPGGVMQIEFVGVPRKDEPEDSTS